MIHAFDTDHAQKYGLAEAIMIVSFQHWIKLNQANGRHQHDGHTWTYNSNKALAEQFTYLTEKQVRRAVDHLVEVGVLQKGNFNQSAYDRTCWYAFVDESMFLKGQIDLPKKANGSAQKGEPIPNTNQITNQLEKPIVADAPVTPNGATSVSEQLLTVYHQHCATLPRVKLLTQSRKQAVKQRWLQVGKDLGRYDPKDIPAGLTWWARFFEAVDASDFLSGRNGAFKASFDWLMKQTNFIKIIEGNYDNGARA